MVDIYFWRQCFILAAGLLLSMGIGFMLGYPAVLNSAIVANNGTDISTTSEQASWITASTGMAGILGSFVLAPILPLYGRKASHIAINVTLLIGWIIFPFANNIIALYAARMVQGLTVGGIYINSIIICEYVHPSRRGYFITLKKVAIAVGTLCCHAMEPFWTWRQIAIFAAVPPFLAIILTLLWPESPSFLALNGRFEECEKSFKWLNDYNEESQKHLKDLIEAQKKRKKTEVSFLKMAKNFLDKDFQKSFAIVSILTLVLDLGGRYYFVAYVVEIMMKLLDNKTSAFYFTLGADLLTVIALSSSTLVIKYFNRRTILFTFGAFTVLLMLTVSLIVYLNTIFKLPTELLWLTALVIIFLCFIVNIGIVPVSFALIGEIFPLEHKGIGSFSSGIVFTSFFALTLKLTPVLIKHTGLYGTYAIYGVSMGLCLLLLYKILPETKDKTLQEIEDDLKGVQRVNSPTERVTLISNTDRNNVALREHVLS